jgi:dTDP-4-amino-4,6-dideoxygalactose transaminase
MIMRIGRTLPPAASPIPIIDIIRALPASLRPNSCSHRFEREIQQEFTRKHCWFLSSGKAALTLILLALKEIYPDRDQVILPAFTCYSVPAAVKRAGLQIKLCDLAVSSFNFDKEKLRKIISEDKKNKRILCVIPTHLFGCPEDVTGVRAIIGPEIPIVEDAAQAMGETLNTDKLGTLGDIGFFSLGRGKALSTMEGGIIVTDRDDLAESIKSLSSSLSGNNVSNILKSVLKTVLTTIFQNPSMFWLPKALPLLKLGETLYEPDFPMRQMSAFHLELARNWQTRLQRHQRARQRNIIYWQNTLPDKFSQVCRKTDTSMIRLPVLCKNMEQRDSILKQSEEQGLGLMLAYPTSINKIDELADEFLDQECPAAEGICNRLLTIPVHEYVSAKDNEQICSLLMGA